MATPRVLKLEAFAEPIRRKYPTQDVYVEYDPGVAHYMATWSSGVTDEVSLERFLELRQELKESHGD